MKTLGIEIGSSRSNIHKVEEFMFMVNNEFGLTAERFQKLMIAVTELVINCIIHGNKEQGHKKVAVAVEYDSNSLVIKIADEGNGFDLSRLADPTLPENLQKESGRGIYIAKSLVDGFSYDHNERGSVFTVMVKK
jgi:serine/threonine-protein kinase RsbW